MTENLAAHLDLAIICSLRGFKNFFSAGCSKVTPILHQKRIKVDFKGKLGLRRLDIWKWADFWAKCYIWDFLVLCAIFLESCIYPMFCLYFPVILCVCVLRPIFNNYSIIFTYNIWNFTFLTFGVSQEKPSKIGIFWVEIPYFPNFGSIKNM